MKKYSYLPVFLVLISAIFSMSFAVNASIYSDCLNGNSNACVKVEKLQAHRDIKKMLMLMELNKFLEISPCNPINCDPPKVPIIKSAEFKKILVELVNRLNKEITLLP